MLWEIHEALNKGDTHSDYEYKTNAFFPCFSSLPLFFFLASVEGNKRGILILTMSTKPTLSFLASHVTPSLLTLYKKTAI